MRVSVRRTYQSEIANRTTPRIARTWSALAGVTAAAGHVPRHGDDDFITFGQISDHLPVTTTLDI